MRRGSLVGFGRGFVAPFSAARQLLSTPRAWPFALVPAIVFVVLEALVVLASWHYVKPWVSVYLATHLLSGGELQRNLVAPAASWLAVLVVTLLGSLLALQLAPALSSPALERIVGIVERGLGAPARPPLGFFAELGCGLRATLLGLIPVPFIVALSLLELVAPPVAVVTTPLKLLLVALGVAWSLFDYPLTLRGLSVGERLRFAADHFSAVLGFGVAFLLVFWLPCCAVLMLPLGVAGSTRLYWEIQREALDSSPSPPQIG
jgi:uncharacterized protein involved in cysteine biosynthesis